MDGLSLDPLSPDAVDLFPHLGHNCTKWISQLSIPNMPDPRRFPEIGWGRFGTIYLMNMGGKEVAVKQLRTFRTQNYDQALVVGSHEVYHSVVVSLTRPIVT